MRGGMGWVGRGDMGEGGGTRGKREGGGGGGGGSHSFALVTLAVPISQSPPASCNRFSQGGLPRSR